MTLPILPAHGFAILDLAGMAEWTAVLFEEESRLFASMVHGWFDDHPRLDGLLLSPWNTATRSHVNIEPAYTQTSLPKKEFDWFFDQAQSQRQFHQDMDAIVFHLPDVAKILKRDRTFLSRKPKEWELWHNNGWTRAFGPAHATRCAKVLGKEHSRIPKDELEARLKDVFAFRFQLHKIQVQQSFSFIERFFEQHRDLVEIHGRVFLAIDRRHHTKVMRHASVNFPQGLSAGPGLGPLVTVFAAECEALMEAMPLAMKAFDQLLENEVGRRDMEFSLKKAYDGYFEAPGLWESDRLASLVPQASHTRAAPPRL